MAAKRKSELSPKVEPPSAAGGPEASAARNVALPAAKPSDPLAAFFYDPDEACDGIFELELPGASAAELPAAPERRSELLAFRLHGERYAVPIASVREIVKPPVVTELPRVRREVLGVISLRGEALPVFSLAELLRLPPPGGDGSEGGARGAERIVVLETGRGPAGLWVDSVEQVIRLPASAIEPPPRGLRGGQAACLEGIGRLDDRLYAILGLGELFAERTG